MRKLLFKSLGLCACALLLQAPAFAAEPAAESAFELGEVVVSGDRVPEVEQSGTVRVITQEDLRRSGARNLSDALKLVPGVQVRRAPKGVRIDMRGYRNRHIKLLLNGIPVNESYDEMFDPEVFDTGNIARIKVMSGTSSLLYGQGGVAGVINIITRKGSPEGSGRIKAETSLTSPAARASAGIGKSWDQADIYLYGSGSYRDGFPTPDSFESNGADEDGGLRDHSEKTSKTLYGNMGWRPTRSTDLGLSVRYNQSHEKLAPTIDDEKYVEQETPNNLVVHISGRHDFDGPVSVRGWAFATREDFEEWNYKNADRDDLKSETDGVSTRLGGVLMGTVDMDTAGSLTLALNAENRRWDADAVKYSSGGGGGGGGGGTTATPSSIDEDVALYTATAEYSVEPLEDLGLTLGVSGHHGVWDETHTDFSALFGARYDLTDSLRLRGNVARLVRYPSLKQLFDTSNGNAELDPERVFQQELGFDYTASCGAVIAVSAFHSVIEDYIERDSGPYENNDQYRFYGIEATAAKDITEHLSMDVGYTFLEARNESDGRLADRLQLRPRHTATAGVSYDFDFGLTVRAEALLGADSVELKDDGSTERLDDFVTADINLIQSVTDHLDLNLRITNIADVEYERSQGQYNPGREIWIGASYSF